MFWILASSTRMLIHSQARGQPIHGLKQPVASQPQSDIRCVGEGLWLEGLIFC